MRVSEIRVKQIRVNQGLGVVQSTDSLIRIQIKMSKSWLIYDFGFWFYFNYNADL